MESEFRLMYDKSWQWIKCGLRLGQRYLSLYSHSEIISSEQREGKKDMKMFILFYSSFDENYNYSEISWIYLKSRDYFDILYGLVGLTHLRQKTKTCVGHICAVFCLHTLSVSVSILFSCSMWRCHFNDLSNSVQKQTRRDDIRFEN